MVGVAFWTGLLSAAGSAVVTTLVREVTLALVRPPVAVPAPFPAAAAEEFDFELPTCPASCPGPTVDVCVDAFVAVVVAAAARWEDVLWEIRVYLGVVGLVIVAFALGRWTAPAQARRPHGRRWPDARAGGRG